MFCPAAAIKTGEDGGGYAKEDGAIQLYRTEERDKITDKTTEKIGWDTNERSKSLAIDTLSRDLEDGQLRTVRTASAEGFRAAIPRGRL